MKIFLLLIFALVTSCGSSSKAKEESSPQPVLEYSSEEIGGVLISNNQLLHVAHWPQPKGTELTFLKKGKEFTVVTTSFRIVSPYEEGDVSIIEFHPPLPCDWNIPVINQAKAGEEVFVYLHPGNKAVKTRIHNIENYTSVNTSLVSFGDSGRPWIVIRDGKEVVVGLTSRSNGINVLSSDITNYR